MKNTQQSKEVAPRVIADELGVSRATVSRWRAAGCPCRESKLYGRGKTASRPLYNLEQVKEWLKKQHPQSRKEAQV